jgi:phospholipase/carboxylesterase
MIAAAKGRLPVSKSEQSLRVPSVSGAVAEVEVPLRCASHMPQGPLQRLVVGMHGFGDSSVNFASLAEEFRIPGTYWVFPEGPEPVPFNMAGGSQWFPLFSEFRDSLEKSLTMLETLLQTLLKHTELNWNQVCVLGFSQGASVALNLLARSQHTWGGVAALSGFFCGDYAYGKAHPSAEKTPVFLAHGLQDNVVLPTMFFEAKYALQHLGFSKVTSKTYAAGHTISPQEFHDLRSFLIGEQR